MLPALPSAAVMTCLGFHLVRNQASTTMEIMAESMSTSHGPWKFEIRNCGMAKLTPATRMAGQIAIVLRMPQNVITSQKGTITEKNGSCRPTMADSVSR